MSNMAELVAIPLKKPSDVDVVKPLTNVIRSTYSGTGKDYTDAIAEFSKLRNNALWRAFEKYESSLQVIYRYESSLFQLLFRSCVRRPCDRCHELASGTSSAIPLASPPSSPSHHVSGSGSSGTGDEREPVRSGLRFICAKHLDNERLSRTYLT